MSYCEAIEAMYRRVGYVVLWSNWRNVWLNLNKSIDVVQFYCTITPAHTFHKSLSKNYRNCIWTFCFRHHTSTLTTFSRAKPSIIRTRQKRPSLILSNSEHPVFALFQVGKSVLFVVDFDWIDLVLINLLCFESNSVELINSVRLWKNCLNPVEVLNCSNLLLSWNYPWIIKYKLLWLKKISLNINTKRLWYTNNREVHKLTINICVCIGDYIHLLRSPTYTNRMVNQMEYKYIIRTCFSSKYLRCSLIFFFITDRNE